MNDGCLDIYRIEVKIMAWYQWKYFEKIFDGNYWGEACGDRKMACCLQVQCHQPTWIILLFGSVGKKSSSFSIKHLLCCYNQSTFILVVIGYKKKLSKINCLFPRKAECSLLLITAMTCHKYHIKGHKISLCQKETTICCQIGSLII